MTDFEAIQQRHSVRSYQNRPLDEEAAAALEAVIEQCNIESGLHIQLVKNEPKAFDSAMAHYGNFKGVTNYIAIIGKKSADFEERCGYYGERIVLEAQKLGLNTCWVALTFKKIPEAYKVDKGEKLEIVISLGYGETQGSARKSKTAEDISNVSDATPEWFNKGIESVLLAPTARNQQKFRFDYADGKVTAKAGLAFYSKVDLGIAKLHFEIASGKGKEIWA